jgi:hypothetical protein
VCNAVGIGVISGVIIMCSTFSYTFFQEDETKYNLETELNSFNDAETKELMEIFERLDSAPQNEIDKFIESTIIPQKHENLIRLKDTGEVENIVQDILKLASERNIKKINAKGLSRNKVCKIGEIILCFTKT